VRHDGWLNDGVLALVDVRAAQRRGRRGRATLAATAARSRLRTGQVEDLIRLASLQVLVVARRQRQRQDALVDAFDVDLQRVLRLGLGRLHAVLDLVGQISAAERDANGSATAAGRSSRLRLTLLLVTLLQERRWQILTQHQ